MSAARNRVLEKGRRLFADNGVDSVSMRDLALELHMQAPSLYSHFCSKESLINGTCDGYLQAMHRMLDNRAPRSISQLLDAWRGLLDRHVDAVRIVHGDPAVRDLSSGQLGRLQDNLLSLEFEKHGIRTELTGPLIAMFRSPYMVPAAGVDVHAVKAAGDLILGCARQPVTS